MCIVLKLLDQYFILVHLRNSQGSWIVRIIKKSSYWCCRHCHWTLIYLTKLKYLKSNGTEVNLHQLNGLLTVFEHIKTSVLVNIRTFVQTDIFFIFHYQSTCFLSGGHYSCQKIVHWVDVVKATELQGGSKPWNKHGGILQMFVLIYSL